MGVPALHLICVPDGNLVMSATLSELSLFLCCLLLFGHSVSFSGSVAASGRSVMRFFGGKFKPGFLNGS